MEERKNKRGNGGVARAEALTPNERRSIARKAAIARWKKTEGEIPNAIRQGSLVIGETAFDCYVLDDKRRFINKRAMAKALGMKSEGGNVFLRTLSRKGLGSVIPDSLREKIDNPLIFKPLNGDPAHGYEATVLIDVCDAIWTAKKEGKLAASQENLGIQSEIIIRSAAKLGIISLIDEATGYIDDKEKDEYQKKWKEFLQDEFAQWNKEFPEQWLDMWYRLYNIKRISKTKHPRFFAKLTRKYIYAPLANSNGAILERLDEKNPVVYKNGGRRYKMFQFLSEEVGLPAFRAHLWQVIGIGQSSRSKEGFERGFNMAFPQSKGQIDLFEFEDEG